MMLRYQRDLRVALLNRIGANDHTPL
jgi:hypothetical protein